MDHFEYRNNQLFAEDVNLTELAKEHGTPAYVYSKATFERHWNAFDKAFGDRPHLICYAVKANSNLAILNVLAGLGSGFDIVSIGELERVLKAGGEAAKIVFSGVGKKSEEIRRALEVGIRCFNVESEAELQVINEIAGEMQKLAPVSIRVNPNVDAKTHPYISTGLKENKFGIAHEQALAVYQRAQAMPNIEVHGIDCHIGSQLTEIEPFVDALKRVLELVDQLKGAGIELKHLDLGGGLGIRYQDETPPQPAEQIKALLAGLEGRDVEILIEPGRAIAGNAGILLTEVLYLKHSEAKDFAIIDAAMNDLMRPALYSAWQEIVSLQPREGEGRSYDLVGPVCETGDFLGKDRKLSLQEGDFLAVKSAGAYGFSMSSNYNSRPRAVEIMVDGEKAHVIRQRESLEQLLQGESILP
ncbi:MAG: diaminopimelate decarboxylase [endosymbiont of Galathealinum brachiosum]|uniref:Diaminopimelate decarboxylase n=1 Tax=endosymbiont of Galathealinum brachiosum TaxID=2200906 RepID=A0A370DCI5_9GAMM|nr:MAG: diaminopimelate decarboxylase [endosymbiont of Galathealinum brachiosum]